MPKTPLFRLCYASTAKCTAVEIGNILEASFRNNVELNVTGALFYGNHYFLQFLEGERSNINAVYRKIAMDERHVNLHLLEFREVGCRYFEDWSMKYVHYPLIMDKVLQETGLKEFNPYLLDDLNVNALAETFRNHYEPEITPETLKRKTGFEIQKIWNLFK